MDDYEDYGYGDYDTGYTGYDYSPGYTDYSGPTGSGQGGYSIGGEWYPIEAPYTPSYGSGMTAGEYDASRGAAPNPRTSGYTSTGADAPTWGWTPASSASGGGGSSYAPQPLGPSTPRPTGAGSTSQRSSVGSNMNVYDQDLYAKFKNLLLNPNFSGDPTYQFLYNQGLQALNRNLAAQRKTLSGQGMNDTFAYGAGMSSKYLQDLIPLYRPTPLGQTSGSYQTGGSQAQDGGGGFPGFDLGLDRSGFTASAGNGIGWGGVNMKPPGAGGVNPASNPGFAPRPLTFNENYSPGGQFDPYYDGYDIEGGPAYG